MIQNWKFQRGDIFFTRFDNAIGSEQSGNRPAVVLQNDVGNFYSPTLIVATLTSKAAKKYTQPTHCLLVNEFLSVPSIVQAEQIFTVDNRRIIAAAVPNAAASLWTIPRIDCIITTL